MFYPIQFCFTFLLLSNYSLATHVGIGIIIDLDTTLGKITKTCISMALEDHYSNNNHTTTLIPHFIHSNSQLSAASAAIHLLKNAQVMAIFAPQTSLQADFVTHVSDQAKVPIISQATSTSFTPQASPYLVRSAQPSSYQAKAISAIVQAFGWRQVVFIYQDSNGLLPFLADHLLRVNVISSNSLIPPSATEYQIIEELCMLKTMQTRVFIVHMSPSLASVFFKMVNRAGMMTAQYVWIVTDGLTSLLGSVDSETIEEMQGVIGIQPHVPPSSELKNFTRRWSKRFHTENPGLDKTELNVYGLWACDSMKALACAIEQVGVSSPQFDRNFVDTNLTDLEAIGVSNDGPKLAPLLRNLNFKGLSGDFHIVDGQLKPSLEHLLCSLDLWFGFLNIASTKNSRGPSTSKLGRCSGSLSQHWRDLW